MMIEEQPDYLNDSDNISEEAANNPSAETDETTIETATIENEQFLKSATEALIFASPEPLTETNYIAALGKRAAEKLPGIVLELNLDYEREGRAFEILHVAGGYQFFTRRDYSGVLRKLFAERARTRLSRAALETLAVVAFRGPVTRAEIDEIRGVDCGGVLRTLLDRRLVAVKGRANVLGRPLLYETTPEFLKHFGLADLSDLPRDSELLREWGQPRSIEAEPEDETQVELYADSKEPEPIEDNGNGRVTMPSTEENEPDKDTNL
ncbi:MAG: SMC-Scp complex subunit ScpB [Calditrichota bacterium]